MVSRSLWQYMAHLKSSAKIVVYYINGDYLCSF